MQKKCVEEEAIFTRRETMTEQNVTVGDINSQYPSDDNHALH